MLMPRVNRIITNDILCALDKILDEIEPIVKLLQPLDVRGQTLITAQTTLRSNVKKRKPRKNRRDKLEIENPRHACRAVDIDLKQNTRMKERNRDSSGTF
jgi:hypothetical protein